jgi:DNA gyrase subunit A
MSQKSVPEEAPKEVATGVRPRNIVEEMRQAYISYAMSVITDRALPDVRDGLKPVHRRILYAMHDTGLTHSSKTRKSATVVGEVIGKYHPHGDVAVYDSMVKMAQTFVMRYPLIIGQGNFGSIDGDNAAAYRYTEAKMSRMAGEMLRDIDKETVNFIPNFDNTKKEPTVLPAAVPNLLLNGTLGIAVGMATNIPPHNLREVCAATTHLIDEPSATTEDLLQFVQGPDFPTGCIAFNQKDIAHAYSTGRGGVLVRGEAEIVEGKKGDFQIVITSIPYRVNKADMLQKIADLVHEKKIEGIKDVRDESTDDIRVVIELKGTGHPQTVLNALYKHTQLEETFHYNVVALVDGVPQTLSLKSILESFVKHRKEVVTRRTQFDLGKAKDREHILLGLKKALDHIDEIIALIKKSKTVEDAKLALMKTFKFSERQAIAILEMRLQKLAGLERKKIEDELKAVQLLIEELESLLKSEKKMMALIKKEIEEVAEKYGDDRRTKIMKRGMNWQVTRGWVLAPVRYIQIMRNERETPSHRTQRRSLFLTQVSYVFDVEPVLNKDAKHPPAVYLTMLETALKTGRQFKPLFLGMRECLGNFGPPPPEWRTLAAQSNPQGVSLGTMPYHVQYTPEGPGRTVFANYTYDSNTGMYVPKERPSC